MRPIGWQMKKCIVGMEEPDDIAGSQLDAFVEGIVNSLIGFGNNLSYPVGDGLNHFKCIVIRYSFNDNVFDVASHELRATSRK